MSAQVTSAQVTSLWAALMAQTMARNGIEQVIIAPGSRSTPLVAAIEQHTQIQTKVISDERSAAFYALGHSRGADRPAVVITTSGSAITHAYPAIAEASVDNIPLLLISADRPPELHGVGANQTFDQTNIFGKHVRQTYHLPAPNTVTEPSFVVRIFEDAIDATQSPQPGPVHINCPFRKPLEPVPFEWPDNLGRTHRFLAKKTPSPEGIRWLKSSVAKARRGLLVIGRLAHTRERQAAQKIADDLGWLVFADAQSGIIGDPLRTAWLDPAWRDALSPDVVLWIGGRLINTQIWAVLSEASPLLIQVGPERMDPARLGFHRIEADLTTIPTLQSTRRLLRPPIPPPLPPDFGEMQVAEHIVAALPSDHILFVASGMPIRDVDRCAQGAHIVANRGLSGIDGIIASAVGYAEATGRPTTLLIGDQAFAHDLGSLSLVQSSIRIVVIDNGGGHIFDMLPIAQSPKSFYDRCFVAPPTVDLAMMATAHGLNTYTVDNFADFDAAFIDADVIIARTISGAAEHRENYADHCRKWLITQGPNHD